MIKRILIVGFGSIGKRHLRIARDLFPNADIQILRHRKVDSIPSRANGNFFNIEDATKFLPQIAILANPATHHLDVANALADIGVHLLIEKPLASSIRGVKGLVEKCDRHLSVLMIGYNLRFLSSLKHFRNSIRKGGIGNVLSVRCEVGQDLPSWRPGKDYQNGVSARRDLGGGVLLELSHEIDYLRWIFGEIEWVKASLSTQSKLDIDVEDTAHLVVGFESKGKGEVLIASINMDFIRQDHTRICLAIGEKGSLRWNGLTGEVEYYKSASKKWELIFKGKDNIDDSYLFQWRHFISCIKEKKDPLVSGEDGEKVLEIIEAARQSSTDIGQMVSYRHSSSRVGN